MIRRLIRVLDDHWFRPSPSFYLSLTRVVVFGAVVYFLVNPFPFGEPGSLARQHWLTGMDDVLYQPIPALKALLLPFGGWGAVRPSPEFLQAVWLVAVLGASGAVLGVYARFNMLACAAATTLLFAHGYSYREFHHPEAALMIALWVLALGPVTGAGSWERLAARARDFVRTRKLRPRVSAADAVPVIRWPLRLLQWVMALIYLSAGMSKLINGGLDWLNGHTLGYYLAADGTYWLDGAGIGMWLAQYPSLMTVLSAGTLVFELTFVLAVLFPRLAWLYVFGGTAIHIGIFILQRAPFFQFILLYVVFAEAVYLTLKAAPATLKRMTQAVGLSRRRAGQRAAERLVSS